MMNSIKTIEKKARKQMATMTPYKEVLPFDQNSFGSYVRQFSDKFLVEIFPFVHFYDLYTYIDTLLKHEKYNVVNSIFFTHDLFKYILTNFYFDVDELMKCTPEIPHYVYKTNTNLTKKDKDYLSIIEKIAILHVKIPCCEAIQQTFNTFSRQFVLNVVLASQEGYIWHDAIC
jgi:hypothetical protein